MPGVALGDNVVSVSFGKALLNVTVTGYVNAADSIQLVWVNNTGADIDITTSSIRVVVQERT